MAAFDTTRPALGSASFAGQVVHFVQALMASMIKWNDARMTRNALSALSDRELEDIGLVRGDIDEVAR